MEKRRARAWRSWSTLKKVLFASMVFHVVLILVIVCRDFMTPTTPPGHHEVFLIVGLIGGLLVEAILFSCVK